MNKLFRTLGAITVLAGVALFGWTFFSSGMAAHPLVKSCFAVVAKQCPDFSSLALRSARFRTDAEGARLVIAYDANNEQGRMVRTEAVFPLKQDPLNRTENVGANPFEDKTLVIDAMYLAGETKGVEIDPPLRGIPTPRFIHRPVGAIGGYKDGRPVGKNASTFYDLSCHFFRYTDEGGED